MSKKPDDDLFKGSVMTFGEHLEELRGCLWRSLLGIFLGFIIGMFIAEPLVRFIESPMCAVLKEYYKYNSAQALRQIKPDATESDLALVEKHNMVFDEVYIEPRELAEALRKAYPDQAAQVNLPERAISPEKLLPVRIWKPIDGDSRTRMKSLSGQEPFMIYLKAALIAGLVLAGPWVFYQLWTFVAAGLYPTEQKYVRVFLPFSIGLFALGVLMSGLVFQPMLNFFLSFNRSMGIDPEPRISEWMSFVLFLPLGFGLAFQLPLVMLFMERIGLFTVKSYLREWRIAVLIIWVIAAIVTPADPISIFYLAVPLMVLFFGGVLLCKWWPKERSP